VAGLRIRISQDGMKAFLQIPQNLNTFPTLVEIKELLTSNGIVYGINNETVKLISEGRIQNSTVEIARGTAPVQGTDGKVEMLVDLSGKGKPKILDNGRADHQDISMLTNVSKNQPLAKHIHPYRGKEGITVLGEKILPKAVSDIQIVNGTGTCFSMADPDLLLARIDGALSINAKGLIEVKNSQIIRGDIDYSTGNVSFSGDLQINGNVRAGFSVKTEGSLIIKGSIENAMIQCNGNLEITGGVAGGGEGVIECGGDMKAGHIENFTVNVKGDVVVGGDLIHSSVVSGGRVKVNQIIGGSISAFFIEANIVGSSAEPRTILDIGKIFQLNRERYALLKELAGISSKQVLLKSEIFMFVRNGLNDNGKLSSEDENRLEFFTKKTIELYKTCNSVQKRIEEIEKVEKNKPEPAVIIKELFPNTLVKFGVSDKLIMEKSVNVMLKPGMFNVV